MKLKFQKGLGTYYLVRLLLLTVSAFVLFGTPALPIRPEIARADTSYELTANRTANSKLYYLGETPDGRQKYAVDSYIGVIHYKDADGDWQDIDVNYEEADTGDFNIKFTKLYYFGRIGEDSKRCIYPDRNDLSYWIEFDKPYASMGQPTRQDGWFYWDFTNAIIGIRFDPSSVKFGFRLKNTSAPNSITIPFSTQGLTRVGRNLYHNGELVAQLRAPTAIDADGIERDVDISWGQGEVTLTLDTTGLIYPIDIDPTIDVQVGASANDGRISGGVSFSAATTAITVGQATSEVRDAWHRYTGITIPQSSPISVAYETLYEQDSYGNPLTKIYADDQNDPAAPTTAVDYYSRTPTTAGVDMDGDPGANGEHNTPSIVAVIQELVNSYDYSNEAIQILHKDDGSAGANNYMSYRAWDYAGNANGPKLHIEYSAGGVSAPTMDTLPATAVEETTANGTGNVTATGGANLDCRGVRIGTYAGGTYTDNTSENGSFGIGTFSVAFASLSEGTAYITNAFGHNTGGWGYASDNETFLTKPLAPTGLTATPSCGQTALAWSKGTGSDNTTIVYKEGSYPANRTDGTVIYANTGTSYTHYLAAGSNPYYRAWAWVTEAGLEQYSDAYDSDNASVPSITTPAVTTSAATSVEETTTTLNGNVTDVGCQDVTRWFYWDTDLAAPYSDNWSEGIYGTGVYSHGLAGLNKGDKYVFHASVNNTAGTANGTTLYFMTKPDPATLFTVSDNGTTWISVDWIDSMGGDYYEIRYATGSAPTDNVSGTLGAWVASGVGTANITGLSPNTTYYFRIDTHAFEDSTYSTADGNVTYQGTTDIGVPSVTTNAASSVEETTATLNSDVTDVGGEKVTRWFYWDTDLTLPYSDNWSEGTYGAGAYSHPLTGLNKGDKYVFIASANNTAGTSNGTALYFMTKPDPATSLVSTGNGTSWVSFSWSNSASADFIEVRYSTGSAPTDNTSGTFWSWGNTSNTTANITGLASGTTYYVRVFTYAFEDSTYSTADSNPTTYGTTTGVAPTIFPPTDFTLTDLGTITVSGNWTPGVNSTYTMIRVSRSGYPSTTDGGELAYYGDGTTDNWSGYALETITYYFSAWGYGADNVTCSIDYTTGKIGGEGMVGLTVSLTFLGIIGMPLFFLAAVPRSKNLLLSITAALFWFAIGIWWVTSTYLEDAGLTGNIASIMMYIPFLFFFIILIEYIIRANQVEIKRVIGGQEWSEWGTPPGIKVSNYESYRKELRRRLGR